MDCTIVFQGISCIGAIMWSMINCGHGWKLYLQFIFYAYGVYASRINTALLSVVIFLTHVRPNSWLLEKKLYGLSSHLDSTLLDTFMSFLQVLPGPWLHHPSAISLDPVDVSRERDASARRQDRP
jgi:hypothetical protein